MLDVLRVRLNQFVEQTRERTVRDAVRSAVARFVTCNRIVVPAYTDLRDMKPFCGVSESLQVLVVDRDNAASAAPLFRTLSRRHKCPWNIKRGYYAYAIMKNGEIIGDIWCVTSRSTAADPIHPDLHWLGISSGNNCAYMFDMYVVPEHRGSEVTKQLLGGALNHLKEQGYDLVFGFYEKNNLPALWTHRMFGYKELEKRKVSRFFFFSRSEPVAG